MGSGSFGVPGLRHLMSREDIDLRVVTQPDRPAGRGQKERPTPVAEEVGGRAPLKKFRSVNDPAAVEEIRGAGMDVLLVCDFGQILKPAVLRLPSLGPFNLHGSILPAYRGAAPIQRALLDGAPVTGVTLLRVTERCDAGPIISKIETRVDPSENFGGLHARLSGLSVDLLTPFMDQCKSGRMPPEHPQDESRATMAPKIKKEELWIRFDRPAGDILRQIRAFSPSPGAYAMWNGKRVKFLKAAVEANSPSGAEAGTVGASLDRLSLTVTCAGSDCLRVEELQPEGSRVLSAREILNGYPGLIGAVLT